MTKSDYLVELDAALLSMQADTETHLRADHRLTIADVIRMELNRATSKSLASWLNISSELSIPIDIVSEDIWRIILALKGILSDGLKESWFGQRHSFLDLFTQFQPKCSKNDIKAKTFEEAELIWITEALNEASLHSLLFDLPSFENLQQFYDPQALIFNLIFREQLSVIIRERLQTIWFAIDTDEVLAIHRQLLHLSTTKKRKPYYEPPEPDPIIPISPLHEQNRILGPEDENLAAIDLPIEISLMDNHENSNRVNESEPPNLELFQKMRASLNRLIGLGDGENENDQVDLPRLQRKPSLLDGVAKRQSTARK